MHLWFMPSIYFSTYDKEEIGLTKPMVGSPLLQCLSVVETFLTLGVIMLLLSKILIQLAAVNVLKNPY